MQRKTITLFGTLALVIAASAAVGTLVPNASAAACPPPPVATSAFAGFGDNSSYVLANNGSFTTLGNNGQGNGLGHGNGNGNSKDSPWTFTGGASIVSGGNTYNISNDPTDNALSLPAGSSATSACTTAPMITSVVRFFVKNTGSPTGHLHVEILVNGGKDGVLDGGTITASSTWAPTDQIVVPWAHPLKGAVQLQVRLTPVEADASFQVDDVYIDPYCSR